MVLHTLGQDLEASERGNVSEPQGSKEDAFTALEDDPVIRTFRRFKESMSDKEKIAMAIGMMTISKTLCMQKQNCNDAVRVCGILQTVVDAVLDVLKNDE